VDYFKKQPDGHEHLIVFNGDLHDLSLHATKERVWRDRQKLKAIIRAGKPLIFFHNHGMEGGRAAMFPNHEDFGVAGLLSLMVYTENPGLPVEFRVIQLGKPGTSVSYGFRRPAVEEIKSAALEYRMAIDHHTDVAQVELSQHLLDILEGPCTTGPCSNTTLLTASRGALCCWRATRELSADGSAISSSFGSSRRHCTFRQSNCLLQACGNFTAVPISATLSLPDIPE
jgi:hypothetical protein